MSLKKFLKSNEQKKRHAQSVLEYVLLTAVTITALMGACLMLKNVKDSGFTNHFETISHYITGG